jgi:hypothetical protein
MPHLIVAVCIAVCLLLANGCSKNISRATAATVFSVRGNVVFGNPERNNFEPVTLKSRIHDNDTVRSADGASMDLALIPGGFAQLSGDSEIKIEELRIVKDGNETAGGMRGRSARTRLVRGRIIVLLTPSDRSESQFTISVRQLRVTSDSDCLFSIQTDGRTTRVTSAKGTINVSTDAQPQITIPAGYFQTWPSARTKPVAAADDPIAQIDVTDSLKAEEQLLFQESHWRNRRPL